MKLCLNLNLTHTECVLEDGVGRGEEGGCLGGMKDVLFHWHPLCVQSQQFDGQTTP